MKELSPDAFAKKAAYYYTEINFLHPFREGTGRSMREFSHLLSKQARYELEWSKIPTEEYMAAIKDTDDPKKQDRFIDVFRRCLRPVDELSEELWIRPKKNTALKDILKLTEGLPSPKSQVQLERQ